MVTSLPVRGKVALLDDRIWFLEHAEKPEVSGVPVKLRYLAEGNANVVWTVDVDHSSSCSNHSQQTSHQIASKLNGMLLRIRKDAHKSQTEVSDGNHPTQLLYSKLTVSPDEVSTSANKIFETVLKPYILSMKSSHVSATCLQRLNSHLANLEASSTRDARRHGSYLSLDPDEALSFLIQDMRPRSGSNGKEILIHFKPKWLTQSPCAPAKTARRCRTCALAASRGKHRTTDYCPLALVSGDGSLIRKAVSKILDANGLGLAESVTRARIFGALTQYFSPGSEGSGILEMLRDAQRTLDPNGFLAVPTTRDLNPLAMTLRDCTLFLRITLPTLPPDSPGTNILSTFRIDGKLGDLDIKTATEEKVRKWLFDEWILVQRGWYEGIERLEEGRRKETGCCLWERAERVVRLERKSEDYMNDEAAFDSWLKKALES
jgi:inositol-pentakisphosphate 2-kinase